MIKKYKNRYNDVFTFTQQPDGTILWEGNFQYCRIGMPNDYSKAYSEYVKDGGDIEIEEFKNEVHKYDEKKRQYVLGDKYVRMVESLEDQINMVDPSGGPYITRGTHMNTFGLEGIVVDFQTHEKGFLIITNETK